MGGAKKVVLIALCFLIVVGSIFVLATDSLVVNDFFASEKIIQTDKSSVKTVQDCETRAIIEPEQIMGKCRQNITTTTCTNQTNSEPICKDETTEVENDCVIDTKLNDKLVDTCKQPKALIVHDKIKLNIQDYACITSEENGNTIAVCDSKFDGNGDGLCTSGETCMKFIIDVNNNVVQLEKNSKDYFQEKDKSFFLEKISTEVLK